MRRSHRFLYRSMPIISRCTGRRRSTPAKASYSTVRPWRIGSAVPRAGRGRTKTGQLWAYASDDRPWGGTDPPGIVYIYAPDRKAERPIAHLAGFKGILQVDGYAGYRVMAERGDVELAFCWAHVRRRFYEL